MTDNSIPENNKELVREAIQKVLVDGDLSVADQYWAQDYIQHSPAVPNGLDALKEFFSTIDIAYRVGTVVADGDLVFAHSRVTGFGPKPVLLVDMFRIADGKIAEHWDVIQEEVPASETANGNAMYPIGA